MANIEKLTEKFNKLRIENQGINFRREDLRLLLSAAQIPYSSRINFLVDAGAIINPQRGFYCFPSIPVHISVIKKYYNSALESSRVQNLEDVMKMTIEEAIQVLKESGEYTIYKKVVQWEEVK